MMGQQRRGEPMIATKLHEVIERQGRRRTWMAQELGIHPSLITAYARRHRTCPRDRAERIAQLLGVPLFLVFDLHIRDKKRRPRDNRAA